MNTVYHGGAANGNGRGKDGPTGYCRGRERGAAAVSVLTGPPSHGSDNGRVMSRAPGRRFPKPTDSHPIGRLGCSWQPPPLSYPWNQRYKTLLFYQYKTWSYHRNHGGFCWHSFEDLVSTLRSQPFHSFAYGMCRLVDELTVPNAKLSPGHFNFGWIITWTHTIFRARVPKLGHV